MLFIREDLNDAIHQIELSNFTFTGRVIFALEEVASWCKQISIPHPTYPIKKIVLIMEIINHGKEHLMIS
jgi:hypothetical protein